MAVPTLGQIQRPPGWVWLICDRYPPCLHRKAVALAPFIIRWGPDASSDMLRRCARCQKCGHRGATLQVPAWTSYGVDDRESFPVGPLL